MSSATQQTYQMIWDHEQNFCQRAGLPGLGKVQADRLADTDGTQETRRSVPIRVIALLWLNNLLFAPDEYTRVNEGFVIIWAGSDKVDFQARPANRERSMKPT